MTHTITGERILVTGATGYLGSFLVPRLRDGNQVHVTVRDATTVADRLRLPAERVHGGLEAPDAISRLFDEVQPTRVFHLATHYERRDDAAKVGAMVDANIRFGSLILEAASRLDGCEVVVAGSHFQFADQPNQPSSFYAATKNALCDIARYLHDARGLRWIQPVLYDVYGPADPRRKLINIVLDRVCAGEPVSLPDPEPLHHFVYVEDVVDALVASAIQLRSEPHGSGASVFVTSDELVTPSAVVAAIAAETGVSAKLDPVPYALPERSIMVPFGGPRPEGWAPQVGLRQGIRNIVAAS